jgi:hypothetical protein
MLRRPLHDETKGFRRKFPLYHGQRWDTYFDMELAILCMKMRWQVVFVNILMIMPKNLLISGMRGLLLERRKNVFRPLTSDLQIHRI